MTNSYLKAVVLIAFMFVVNVTVAQGPPPPPPPLPIDGGLFALVAAGLFYGVKNLWNKKNN